VQNTPAPSDAFAPGTARSKFIEYMSVAAAGGAVENQ
jgi:hypothetical protein